MENWDDVRVFLATARGGSSRAGARQLGVNQSTISRRIGQLEERAGVLLFDRHPTGLVLTDAGAELVELASGVEEKMATLDRRLLGRDEHLLGTVRLSMPDFMVGPTAPMLVGFSAQYPQITVEVVVDNGFVSLTHREADLALRLRFASSPPAQFVGRLVAPLFAAAYGCPDYLARRTRPIDLTRLDWVRWDEPWRDSPTEQWIEANVPPQNVRARINTSLAHAELLAAGLGVGFLACHSGDADSRLVRAGPPEDYGMALWLLTHEDLKRTARVRALLRFLGDALAEERARFTGERDGARR